MWLKFLSAIRYPLSAIRYPLSAAIGQRNAFTGRVAVPVRVPALWGQHDQAPWVENGGAHMPGARTVTVGVAVAFWALNGGRGLPGGLGGGMVRCRLTTPER